MKILLDKNILGRFLVLKAAGSDVTINETH